MADIRYPRRTADGRGATHACCESILGPACGHRRGGFDPYIELNRLRRLAEVVLTGTDDPAASAQALAHAVRDLDHYLSALAESGDWLRLLPHPRIPVAVDAHPPLAVSRSTGPCPCRSGYANDPGTHNNQVRANGRCHCFCHGGRS